MNGIPNQHQRGTQTTRGAIASGFKSALSCVVGVPTSYDLQHDTRLRAGGFFLVKLAGRHCPVPFQRNSHRRVCSSLSRRYWHGVERFPRSAVSNPFGAVTSRRFLCKSEHHTDCQVSDAPKHPAFLSFGHNNRKVSCERKGLGNVRKVFGELRNV